MSCLILMKNDLILIFVQYIMSFVSGCLCDFLIFLVRMGEDGHVHTGHIHSTCAY